MYVFVCVCVVCEGGGTLSLSRETDRVRLLELG